MENVDELYEKRMSICKECPLYINTPMGPRCNPKLYLSTTDKTTVSRIPKIGYRRGCGCILSKRNKVPSAHCSLNKW